jgi:hypothetical protein
MSGWVAAGWGVMFHRLRQSLAGPVVAPLQNSLWLQLIELCVTVPPFSRPKLTHDHLKISILM